MSADKYPSIFSRQMEAVVYKGKFLWNYAFHSVDLGGQ